MVIIIRKVFIFKQIKTDFYLNYCPHVLLAAEAAVFSQSIKFCCIHKIDYGHMTEKYALLKQIYVYLMNND